MKNEPLIKKDFYTIDLVKGIENNTTIYLSEIADTVIYVPMETSERCLMGSLGFDLVETDNYFFMHPSRFDGLGVFDKKGNLVRRISKAGRGPGEIPRNVYSFFIDEERRHVVIFTGFSHKRLTFDFYGNLLEERDASKIYSKIFYPLYIGDGKFLSMNTTMSPRTIIANPRFQEAYIIDKNDSIVAGLDNEFKARWDEVKEGKFMFGVALPFTAHDDYFLVTPQDPDTIYKVKDDKFEPYIHLKRGKYDPPFDVIFNYDNKIRKKSLNYLTLHISPVFETNRYIFARGRMKDHDYFFRYNKQTGDISSSKQKIEKKEGWDLKMGFVNDYDGGINFKPYYFSRDGKSLYSYLYPNQIINHKGQTDEKARRSKNKKNFERLRNTVNIDDNFVLMIVRIKD